MERRRSFWAFCRGLIAGFLAGYLSGAVRDRDGQGQRRSRRPARRSPEDEGTRSRESAAADDLDAGVGADETASEHFPGSAAVRKMHDSGRRDHVIAKRQMVALLLLLVTVGAVSWFGYGQIKYRSPPLLENADSPKYLLLVPARIESMKFEITDRFTTVEISTANFSAESGLMLSSNSGEPVEVLQMSAQARNGESIQASGWRVVTHDESSGVDGVGLELIPQMDSPPVRVALTLRNGARTSSGQYQFLRTRRIDVSGTEISADAAEGTVLVNTGSYSVERLATGGVSRPGETQGMTTRYSVTASRVVGVNRDVLPVPAVSVDMVDVERQRGRDPLLLALGAVLGIAGGLLIEIVLTAAHLVTSRER